VTNILLVEDEPLIAEEIRQTLRPAGYEVINGFNGSASDLKAFAMGVNSLIDNSHAAIVLMDINLAGKFDGVEVGKRVREQSKVPVIFLTGYSDAATLTRAIGTGPSGYLIKPISGRQLLAQIELTLQQNGTQKQREEHIEAQAGLWNLTLTAGKIGCTFGWLSQFRYLRDDIGTFDDFRKIIHPGDEKALGAFIADCRTPEKTGAQIEYRLINADGHERWILTKILKVEVEGDAVQIAAINFDISEQKQKELHLQYRATHDSLTNLSNRAYFMAELQQHAAAQTKPATYAVLFADLDKFKPVNDDFGHAAGDRLLIEVAQRFQRSVKRTDIVARFGGDEFVFLIKDIKNTRDLQKISQRILTSLADPVRIDDKVLKIGCSLGGAVNTPYDKSPGLMLHDADVALYAAKKSTQNKFRLFEDNANARVLEQLMTSEALRNAVKQNQFAPYFNPIVPATKHRIAGMRIEIHWNHPVHGSIPFGSYREAAEDSGLIVPITLKILEKVLEYIRGSAAAEDNDFVMVPLNRRLFLIRDWPTIIQMASEQYTEAGLNLVFEMAEAAFSRPQNLGALERLRTSGVQFCLNLASPPHSFQSLSGMPFQFISFTLAGGRGEVDFCRLMAEAGKIVLANGATVKDAEKNSDLVKYLILRREFPLMQARMKKSNRAADTT
jgi:diguanylate cyclase (GGDEF)-like protein